MKFKIALGQITPVTANSDDNRKKMAHYIQEAANRGAKLIIFPELALTGYNCGDIFFNVAEEIPGESCEFFEEEAKNHEIYIVWGMPERGLDGILYNTAVLVGPEGYIGKWRKHALPGHATDRIGSGAFPDRRFFKRGTQSPVFDTALGRIGLLICYDIFYPELVRLLTLKGCDLIVGISGSPSFERNIFEPIVKARAMENTIWFAYTNLVGTEGDTEYWGGGCLIAPGDRDTKVPGTILAKAPYTGEGITIGEVDLTLTSQFRPLFPVLRDLETEMYRQLLTVHDRIHG
ncbi:carbon-nitrogen hydrolase family protein [Fodinisporobacter ferrooxydans]|uniref:Carbon-nitrogen hydrolase family protein n=1 Tax=Fodinisporobacter ferrooxydans TaxID=2901836 RepID=A0ABY4CDW3_9BACL|nr:carbon-nitrogen hydrolase family protein [Alicyclobacillaceae bacterium MYW30-H2]